MGLYVNYMTFSAIFMDTMLQSIDVKVQIAVTKYDVSCQNYIFV